MPDLINVPTECAIAAIQKNVSLTQNLYKYLQKSFKTECISDFFKGFYQFFYDNGYDYDINGFSLVFFVPPHLSGFGWPSPELLLNPSYGSNLTNGLNYLDFITFALEVTPPDVTVEKGTLGIIASETYDYPINVHGGTDMSLTYLDSSDLKLYSFHSIWVRYIHAAISGRVAPTMETGGRPYSTENPDDDDIIDYVGSIYILKFDADMLKPRMIAKALGVFPNAVPFKEQIGAKGQHQVTISNVSYTCSYFYEEPIFEDAILDANNRTVLFREFMETFSSAFNELLRGPVFIDP
jgi:hypothetical protein